jgi:hypothetical protein
MPALAIYLTKILIIAAVFSKNLPYMCNPKICNVMCISNAGTEFNEAEVKSVAEQVITLINEQDTEGLKEISTEQVKADLTDVTLKKLYETIGEGGAFEEVKEMKVQGGTENDKNYAVVTAETEYENKSFTYTITITTDMKLVGLRYK